MKKLVVCRDIIEDEYHFLLICPYYKDIRDQYLPAKYILNPNLHVHKFNILMSNTTEIVIRRLLLFLYYAFEKRKSLYTSWIYNVIQVILCV